jgi:hypothetical protein
MNFLAGPMTRTQIPALNKLVGASGQQSVISSQPSAFSAQQSGEINHQAGVNLEISDSGAVPLPSQTEAPVPVNRPIVTGSVTRPPVPSGFPEFFLPMNLSFTKALALSGKAMPEEAMLAGVLYRSVLLASAQVRFLDRRYSLDVQKVRSVLVTTLDARGVVRWDDFVRPVPNEKEMDPAPDPQARFAAPDGPISDVRLLAALHKDFADWAYRTSKVIVRANSTLGVFATPEVTQADFMKACSEAARTARDADLAKATATLDRQIASLQDKLSREQRELQQDQTELGERKREELVTGAETVFSILGGKRTRRISAAMSKHRMTEQSKADVDESVDAIKEFKQQLTRLEQARQEALDGSAAKWGDAVNNISEIPILPKKTDVYINLFGVAWMPYYQVKSADQSVELPAFQ